MSHMETHGERNAYCRGICLVGKGGGLKSFGSANFEAHTCCTMREGKSEKDKAQLELGKKK